MKLFQLLVIVICIAFTGAAPGIVHAKLALPETTFSTGTGMIKKQKKACLSIPGADELDVSVSGAIHKKNILRIYDREKGTVIKKMSGNLNKIEPFTVSGNSIFVTFNSKGQTTRKGATVRITTSSPITAFKKIKAGIETAADKILTNGARDAHDITNENITLFEKLQKKVASAETADNLIGEITGAFVSIADAYLRISSMSKSIHAANEIEFKNLDVFVEQTKNNKEKISRKIRAKEKHRKDLKRKTAADTSSTEYRKVESDIRGTNNEIDFLESQIVAWGKFQETQVKLIEELRSYSENVGLLLHILNVNANVYNEAAHAMQMQHSVKYVMQRLDNLSDVEEVLKHIKRDWTKIKALKATLKLH
ncbi:MAG: hypothetical protein GY862_26560 [Gammaproteobacteria bacterium]|nr:hypothetical protein [Gammaproteobacteria bacterium]